MVELFLGIFILFQSQKPVVHVFYVSDCGHCMDILLEHIPNLQKKYSFLFKKYDIDIPSNYRLLEQMEEGNSKWSDDLPVVFVADSVFYGEEETREKLGPTLKSLSAIHVPVVKDTTSAIPDTANQKTTGTINVYYFFQPGCDECDRMDIVLKHLAACYDSLIIHRYDIFEDTSKALYEAIAERIDIPDKYRLVVPIIIIGDDYIIKDEISLTAAEHLVLQYKQGSTAYDTISTADAKKHILERFSRFSIFGILIAGLLDGINPCAFATLIFFISYLLFIGRRRKDIIVMSISFISAVFVCYMTIGLGAYGLLRYFTGIDLVAKVIFLCFGILAVVLGVLSLRDYFLARQGKTNKMILQLPLGIKQRIHKNIKEKTTVGSIVIGSLAAGVIISFLEFGCTGQVYLPTITFMVSKAGFSLKPVAALVAYNCMFVLPLIVIAVLATAFSTKNVASVLEKRIPLIKLLTAVLFFSLGILLILSS